ncbi:hypothetical protein V1227_06850 [Lentzea sp. DG1S-22]|uniref:hypothetical protein n=1 Tax=Lentzea sp. DG1S-22 TaxID=3108822 RepID=UPI002E761006|nr:hypothetical protein [Lentzea sp. DG1S-22]WVH82469.1 hypothetical protein V1227_06850 [Lentzea sp. DG1S-22]
MRLSHLAYGNRVEHWAVQVIFRELTNIPGRRDGASTSASIAELDFGRYLEARVLSVVAVVVSAVTPPVLVHQSTGSAGWTSVVTAAEAGRKVIAEPS